MSAKNIRFISVISLFLIAGLALAPVAAQVKKPPVKPLPPKAAPPKSAIPEDSLIGDGVNTPKIYASSCYRPAFTIGDEESAGGTAFTIADKAGKPYLLTAVHVQDADAWKRTRLVRLLSMVEKGKEPQELGKALAKPVYIGQEYKIPRLDVNPDLVVLRIPGKTYSKPLPIAAELATKGDVVFIIGSEAKAPGKPRSFRAKVALHEGGGIIYAVEDKFDAWGFSGGPVVNLQGEVVGTILGGDDAGKHLFGLSSATLRSTLKKAEVELE